MSLSESPLVITKATLADSLFAALAKVRELEKSLAAVTAFLEKQCDVAVEVALVCRTKDGCQDTHSILSMLHDHHLCGSVGLLGFFTTKEARELALISKEFQESVALMPWSDAETVISGHGFARWRKSFPHAMAANISGCRLRAPYHFTPLLGVTTLVADRTSMTDSPLSRFKGLKHLSLRRSWHVTTAGIIAVAGSLEYLDIVSSYQVSGVAFASLRGLRVLKMSPSSGYGGYQITEQTFIHLRGLEELTIEGCVKRDRWMPPVRTYLSNFALAQLRGLSKLTLRHSARRILSDPVVSYEPLRALDELHFEGVDDCVMNDNCLAQLQGLRVLSLEAGQSDLSTLLPLAGLVSLSFKKMSLWTLPSGGVSCLRGLEEARVINTGPIDVPKAFKALLPTTVTVAPKKKKTAV